MSKGNENNVEKKSETRLTNNKAKLMLLFQGLFALVPSSVMATEEEISHPSSVTLLFPKAIDTNLKVDDELGDKHPYRPKKEQELLFKHDLKLKYGIITKKTNGEKETYTFKILIERTLPYGSEILIYDGDEKPENEINSPDLSPEHPDRENFADSAKLYLEDDEGYKLKLIDKNCRDKDHIIDLSDIYYDELVPEDKKLEVQSKYLAENYFENESDIDKEKLAARVFRLRKGTIAGFNASIFNASIDYKEDGTVSPFKYKFQKHHYGGMEKTKKEITDTIVFERELTNKFVTFSVKLENKHYLSNKYMPDSSNIVCLLIEHVSNKERNPTHDYDFSLVYRVANLDKKDGKKKLRRIPKIEGVSAKPPAMCGLALYNSDENA